MSKTRFECRHIISKNWAQMTPGSETLTNGVTKCPQVGCMNFDGTKSST